MSQTAQPQFATIDQALAAFKTEGISLKIRCYAFGTESNSQSVTAEFSRDNAFLKKKQTWMSSNLPDKWIVCEKSHDKRIKRGSDLRIVLEALYAIVLAERDRWTVFCDQFVTDHQNQGITLLPK